MGTSCMHQCLPAHSFFTKPYHLQLHSTSTPNYLSFRSLFCFNASVQALIESSSPTPTTNNYNHLIQSLCKQGDLKQAFRLLTQEAHPTQRTYDSLIFACLCQNAKAYASDIGRRLADDGLYHDPFLSTKLIDMYSRFNSLDDARNVFDRTPDKTIFVWNSLLKALVLAEESDESLFLFRDMVRNGVPFDSFSYSYALKACLASSLQVSRTLNNVRQIHGHVMRIGFDSRVHVATTLVDCYAKIGMVLLSRKVFDKMPNRNVVTWSAMIACYAQNGRHLEALEVFREMTTTGDAQTVPNSVTMVSVLQVCAGLAAVDLGKLVHGYVLRRGFDAAVSVVNALTAMYIKCGSLDVGCRVFETNVHRNVVSWNTMISGHGIHGFGTKAICFFEEMIRMEIEPSPITFLSVLGACSHCGLVEEGRRLFDSMEREHDLEPQSEHYACLVDLLGRAGQLEEAANVIQGMSIEPGPTVWGSLLGACRIHGNIELAERACSHLFELEPWNAGNYILLADIYAEARLWEEVSRVKKLLEERGLAKLSGCSWIEVKKKLYSFVSVDGLNPRIQKVHAFLAMLVEATKVMGYTPNTRVVLYDVAQEEEEEEEEEKEKLVMVHSEKLALAFGLMNTAQGEVIRITKNLRLCEDCHSMTKFVSKYTRREILVRDVNRFHHFRDGICSCMNYW